MHEDVFRVVLAVDGTTQVDGKPVPNDDQILGLARAAQEKNANLRPSLKADVSVPYGRVIHVIDLLKQAHVGKIAFRVLPTAPANP